MSLRHLVIVTALFVVTGCTAEATGPSEPKVRLTGSVGTGQSGVKAQSFGNVSADSSGLHVAARRLHHRGENSAVVDVPVSADGHWVLDVARGGRWVITVDGKDGHSALVTFAGGKSAIAIGENGGSGSVDVGNLRVVGGQAVSNVTIDGEFNLAATLAEADEVFEAADGALLEAEAAVEAAQKAAEEAEKAAEDAQAAAEAAQKAAEEAQKAAGQ